MSDRSSKYPASIPPDELTIEKMLKSIHDKLQRSEVLNGGFDRMQEHLEELKQDVGEIRTEVYKVNVDLRTIAVQNIEFKEDLARINEAIYNPDSGIYTRITKTSNLQEQRDDKMDVAISKIDNLEKLIEPIERTDEELKKIAGKDLKELDNIVKTRLVINRMFWLMVTIFASGIGKVIWDLATAHIK